jgi:hypothetical protein
MTTKLLIVAVTIEASVILSLLVGIAIVLLGGTALAAITIALPTLFVATGTALGVITFARA